MSGKPCIALMIGMLRLVSLVSRMRSLNQFTTYVSKRLNKLTNFM